MRRKRFPRKGLLTPTPVIGTSILSSERGKESGKRAKNVFQGNPRGGRRHVDVEK